jgi:hypothetical protein
MCSIFELPDHLDKHKHHLMHGTKDKSNGNISHPLRTSAKGRNAKGRLQHELHSTRTHSHHVQPQHAGPTAGFNSMAGDSFTPFALVLLQNHSSSKYTRSRPPDTTSHTTQSQLWRSWCWNPGPQPCNPVNNIELPSFLFYLKDSHHVSGEKSTIWCVSWRIKTPV